MAVYKIEVNTHFWECECCGSGEHFDITIYQEGDRIWGYSQNDQFGGSYRSGDDESIKVYDYEEFVCGLKVALEVTGNIVLVEYHHKGRSRD